MSEQRMDSNEFLNEQNASQEAVSPAAGLESPASVAAANDAEKFTAAESTGTEKPAAQEQSVSDAGNPAAPRCDSCSANETDEQKASISAAGCRETCNEGISAEGSGEACHESISAAGSGEACHESMSAAAAGETYNENTDYGQGCADGQNQSSVRDGFAFDKAAYTAPVPPRKTQQPAEKKKTGKKILSYVLLAAIAFVFGFGGGFAADAVKNIGSGQQGSSSGTSGGEAATPIVINVSENTGIAEAIAAKVVPSVVSVTCVYETTYSYGFGWGSYTQESSSVGSGFIVTENGYIVTNSHVVNDGSYKLITISLYGGSTYNGSVLWSDSTLDLAVVKIDADGLTPVELGDSDEIKLGSYAAAIGNPLGLTFERSITQGIISGLDRTITVSSSSSSSGTTMEGLIQTDAAINSGNSGGPLLNAEGKVIGIASAKATSGESMGFAIPINIIKPILSQIEEKGYYERVYLGISAIGIEQQTSVSEENLKQYYGATEGIYIAAITKNGGAAKAGLQEKDVITKVAGVKVGTMNKLYSVLINYRSGDIVEVEYIRNGKTYTTNITLMTSAEIESRAQ